jgi:CRISPR-associated protein Cmr2
VSGESPDASVGQAQIAKQLHGFPEVHWTSVPTSLASIRDGKVDTAKLAEVLSRFYPPTERPGFLGSQVYRTLSGEIDVDGANFYRPGPGTLYPAFHDLLERSHAAAKTARPFLRLPQEGYRCSLCGEREWLTTDRALLQHASDEEGSASPWPRISRKRPGIAKQGERLCAICGLKRAWPTLFQARIRRDLEHVRDVVDPSLLEKDLRRYVVSTHTMALASTFSRMLSKKDELDPEQTATS